MKHEQNGHHLADVKFKFLGRKRFILIEISLWFVPKGSIDELALVEVIAWCHKITTVLSKDGRPVTKCDS